jgi:hypothetical protein
MSIYSRTFQAAALLLVSSVVVAQSRDACSAAPGFAFGITSVNCASCSIKYNGSQASFVFFAEPVVLETATNSPFIVGDVIEAVHGRPITTEVGAAEFTHPPAGPNEVTVRRGRDRKVVPVTVSADAGSCARPTRVPDLPTIAEAIHRLDSLLAASRVPNDSMARLRDKLTQLNEQMRVEHPGRTMRITGPGYSEWAGDGPIIIVDGEVVNGRQPFDYSATGGFGIGVACTKSCTSAFGSEGVTRFTYYRYSSPPAIIAVRPGGPADRVGIKVGDVIEKVDGISILEDAGALKLWSVFRKDSIRLSIIRDGATSDYLVKVR